MTFRDVIISASLLTALSLFSCGKSGSGPKEVRGDERDNIVEVTLTGIDDKLPMFHDGSSLSMFGDTMIILDRNSTDRMLVAYDINHDTTIARFGGFGAGPGEISNPGNAAIDRKGRRIILMDYGQWRLRSFDIDSAIADAGYAPATIVRLDSTQISNGFPDRYTYLCDTAIIGRQIMFGQPGKYDQGIGILNPRTGMMRRFGDAENLKGFLSEIAVSLPDGTVAETGSRHDMIRIYDLDGTLRRIIYGPDFEEKHRGRMSYFTNPVIANGRLYAVYSATENYFGTDIIEMDIDGNYLRTLRIGMPVVSIAYNEAHNRLYVVTQDTPQFGYIDLGNPSSSSPRPAKSGKSTGKEEPMADRNRGGKVFKGDNVLPGRPTELVDTPKVFPQLNGKNAWWQEPDGKYTYAFHFTNVSDRTVTIERVEFETEPSDTPIIRFVKRPLRPTTFTLAVIKISKPWKPGLRHITFYLKGQETPEVHTMEILDKIPYN